MLGIKLGLGFILEQCENPIIEMIELYNNKLHGLSPPGGFVSSSGGFALLLCDQGLHFASVKLCQAS